MSKYIVAMNDQTIAGASTLVLIHTESTAGSRGSVIEILRMWADQNANETAEQLGIQYGTKASVFPTLTSTTPQPTYSGGNASGITGGTAGAESTAGTDASAEGAGTWTPWVTRGFYNLAGWEWVATEKSRIIIPADVAFGIKLLAAPTNLNNWNAGIEYEELT